MKHVRTSVTVPELERSEPMSGGRRYEEDGQDLVCLDTHVGLESSGGGLAGSGALFPLVRS